MILKGTEHAKQEFTRVLDRGFRGGSRTDMSPLEQRFGFISQMYEHLYVTYENFTDYVSEKIAYLKKVYGDNLTNEMVNQYFALHPFLDSEEYQYQLQRMQLEYDNRFGEEEPNTSEYHASSQPIDPEAYGQPGTSEYHASLPGLPGPSQYYPLDYPDDPPTPLRRTDSVSDLNAIQKETRRKQKKSISSKTKRYNKLYCYHATCFLFLRGTREIGARAYS